MRWLIAMLFVISLIQLAMIKILEKDIARLYKQDVISINHIISSSDKIKSLHYDK